MESSDDSALLRQYCDQHSEDAFAALVARHINLVYSVALRQVGNPHHAQEITQAVFIILARKARGLRHDEALSSWLFQTTHLTCKNFIRGEMRRHRREQEAHMQSMLEEPGNSLWERIAPLLDSAVAALNEKDRRAVVLRFYEGRNLRDVGEAFGTSEEAAKKRVARALEKLQRYFSRRGICSSSSIIAEAISANCVQAAPLTLAKLAGSAGTAKGAAASVSVLTLVKGALNIMAWTKIKTSMAVAAGVLLAAGTTTFFLQQTTFASIDGTFRSVIFKHRYEQYAKRFEGTWEGNMVILMNSTGSTEHRHIVVRILNNDGAYRAIVDEVDEGLKNIIVPTVTLDQLSINFATDSLSYHGVFHKDATEIRGVWRYPLGSFLLVLTRTNTPDSLAAPLVKEDYAPKDGSDLRGVWKTVVTNRTAAQTLYLKITEDGNGKLRGECDSPDKLPLIPFPVTGLSYTNPRVHFAVLAIGGSFTGSLSNDFSTLKGQWKWIRPGGGTKTSRIVWTRVFPEEEEIALQDGKNFNYSSDAELQGHWNAAFPPKFGIPLNLALNIAKVPDGNLSATLDSPDQSLFEIPVEVLQFKPPKVQLEVKSAHAAFDGRLMDGKLSGDWSFYDVSAPVVFERRKP